MIILAIDAGTTQSGYALLNDSYIPIEFGKMDNNALIVEFLRMKHQYGFDLAIFEQLSSYGNIIGDTVLQTAVWTGRLHQKILDDCGNSFPILYVKRKQYVTDLTTNPKAKDSNVRQYLVDRFEPNASNNGKGTKKNPSRFYGVSADAWTAIAVAVWCMDNILGNKAHV